MSKIPVVRDVMATSLITLRADMPIHEAIALLLKNRISGAPVVDAEQKLVGVLSEKDCLRVFANDAYFHLAGGAVGDYMSRTLSTVGPDDDVFKVADLFLRNSFRRLPVLEGGRLVGQVSRRDILKASIKMLEVKKPWTDARYLSPDLQALLSDKPPADAK
jgi:CBS domain-containing protein